jgi:secondary thiamine-phosphate synthase enzyme
MLRQALDTLCLSTTGRGFIDVTSQLRSWLASVKAKDGLLTVMVLHTSASLLIQENADPAVRADLERFFTRLVPDGDPLFLHTDEGPDDMSAHVRAALTQVHLSLPVRDGQPTLGAWQGVFLWEHRTRRHQRTLSLHFLGT